MKTTKNSNFNNLFLLVLFFNFCLFTSSFLRAQDASLRMDMEWLSSTTNTADFQVRITNLGTVPFKFNSVIIRGVHAAGLTTGTVSWLALNNNTIPEWLGWPNVTINLPYTVSTRKLNYSSSAAFFTSATAPTIPIPAGTGVVIGTFRMSTTSTWVPNSNFNFVWDATGAVVGYIGTSTTASSLQQAGVSGGSICGSCLTVTAPAAQLLNPQAVPPPSSSVLTGTATICSGSSTNLSVAVTGGVSPYTVTVTDGTNNYSATSASPVSIPVSPTSTSTYSIVSVTGGGTGTGNSGTPTVTVVPAPAATISYSGSPWCSSSAVQAVTQTGTTGGTYSSTAGLTINASTGAITPSTSTAGTYTVTYTIAAASPCAALSVTTSVTITAAQSATISYASSSICGSSTTDQSVTQTGTTGGTYSSSPSGLSISSTTGAITPNTSTIGTYTVTYTLAASGVCPAVSATTTITISSALTTPTITYAGSPFCKSLTSPQVVTQTGSTGGVYTSSPAGLSIDATTGAITPSTSTATTAVVTYTVTYTVTASGCSSVSATAIVPIGPITSGSISYTGSPYCKTYTTAPSVTRSTVPSSTGTYTISPTTGWLINSTNGGLNAPSASTAGVYTVTLTLSNAQTGGCGITTFTAPVTILNVPTQPAISYTGSPWCQTNTTAQSVSQTGTSGGTYTSSPAGLSLNATTGAITPSSSTPATYTVTYTISATGCTALTATANVTITATPIQPVISYAGSPFCKTLTTAQSVTISGTTGGAYTASPAGLSISATTGAITPSTSTPGAYTVTYTTPSAGCTALSAQTSVSITATPTVTIAYTGTPFCSSAAPVSVTQTLGAGAYTGGTYTSTVGLSINASTGQITPSSSTAGTYTVTYTIPAGSGCAIVLKTTSVTITALPAATISYAGAPFCKTLTSAQSVTRTGTAGGTYTSTTGLSISSTTGAITPSTSTAGTYTVSYTIAATGGCSAVTTTTSVSITAAPAATISYSGSPWCASSTANQPVTQGGTTEGTYSSTTGLSINASTGLITPSTSTAGAYTVTYTIAASGGCLVASTTTSVTITASPTAPTGLSCWQTATLNTTTCSWVVSGTQAAQPTGLSCWQTATFNTTSCVWDVTGTQAAAPTGLACYETATFNTTTCVWVVSGTQTTNTTTVSVSVSYTWANNGQTYTSSGTYYGNDVNCVAQVLILTINSATIRMDMEWLSSTASTADFQIRLTNTGQIPVTFNALIVRGVHSPSITTGTITWKALNNNTLPGWLNWPNTGTANLPYISSQRKLNFSSSTGIFTSATAQAIPSGSGVVMGTFRMSTTTSWEPNSDFGFVWEMTSGGVVAYVNGATVVTNIQHYGVTGGQICGQCLTVSASGPQPLNTISPLSAVLSGNATICAGSTTNLSVAVTGGTAPYMVTVSDGINNYTATGTSPLSIAVSPSATSTYSISSVTGGITGTGTGSATVSVTPVPSPTLLCYQTATLNTSTCSWDITGTQAAQPTLACYQTATFNETTCAWVVSGTQATAPTGLLSWQTAAFNTTTCVWDITGTEPTSSSTLNITMFIQGYYAGNNTMTTVLANQAQGTSTTNVDTVLVQLINPTSLLVVASAQGVLQTNGTAACTFSTAQIGSFYIAVKHRNSIETWSTTPIAIGASSSYNFTTSANKAYGDNMIEMEPDVWAFYSGDINQDGFIESSDFPILFNSNDNFEEGYLITDLNGDGYVDTSDYPILFNNSDNFIESMHPY